MNTTRTASPSRRACEAAILMGAPLDQRTTAHAITNLPADRALLDAPITLITGPSGAGKSTLLNHARDRFREARIPAIETGALRPADKPCVDLLGADTLAAVRALASVGLAELRCFVRRPRELSEGQRLRLRLALAIDKAPRTRLGAILIDEFASSLDDLSARTLALLLRRLAATHTNLRFVAATNRPALAPLVAPNLHLAVDLTGRVTLTPVSPAPRLDIAIAPGTREHLERLAPFHYRAGMPATVERVLRATDPATGTLAGVLAVSRPTLNGAWRRDAWPELAGIRDKSARASEINRSLRTISRVIVDPRFRAIGVAKALVRAYLRDPETARTEALAAMGVACPFFRAAGMTEHTLERAPRDRSLLETLCRASVEPWRLATPDLAYLRAARHMGEAEVARALRTWARASGATRALASEAPPLIFNRAATRIASPPVAYAYTRP